MPASAGSEESNMRHLKNIMPALAACILFPEFIRDSSVAFSNSFFSVVLFAVLMAMFYCADHREHGKRMKKYTRVLGFLFSVMTAFGCSLNQQGYIPFRSIPLLASVLVFARVYAVALGILWEFLEKAEQMLYRGNENKRGSMGRLNRLLAGMFYRPVSVFLFLFVCWMPCYISIFPGNFVYDATGEFYQLEQGFHGNYPRLHSLLITGILSLAYRCTGSYNAGIAVYTILQMCLLAAMFTHILCTFGRFHANRILVGCLSLYYALFPVVHLLVTCTVRDVLFSGLLNYVAFLFLLMARDRKEFLGSPRKTVFSGGMLVLALLARNNNAGAAMAVLLGIFCMLVWFWAGRENRKGAAVFAGSTICCHFILASVLALLCPTAHSPTVNTSLSLLTQSVVRAYQYGESDFTEAERKEFEAFFGGTDVRYVDRNGDDTKGRLLINDENTVTDFLCFWGRVGWKHPGEYMNAILSNTVGMWFPDTVIDGYKRSGKYYKDYEKCYFYFGDKIEAPGSVLGLLPGVAKFYHKIGLMISFERIPVVSMLFSIGFQFWLVLHCCFYAAYRKCRAFVFPLAVIMVYAVMSACVPLVLLRYFALLFFCIPMIIMFTLQPQACAPGLGQPGGGYGNENGKDKK